VREEVLNRYDIYTADECFLSGTGAEVMPIAEVDGRKIGTATPGPVTKQLSDAFHALVRKEGDPIW
jgi:branched-chain amino acid aminotransferase